MDRSHGYGPYCTENSTVYEISIVRPAYRNSRMPNRIAPCATRKQPPWMKHLNPLSECASKAPNAGASLPRDPQRNACWRYSMPQSCRRDIRFRFRRKWNRYRRTQFQRGLDRLNHRSKPLRLALAGTHRPERRLSTNGLCTRRIVRFQGDLPANALRATPWSRLSCQVLRYIRTGTCCIKIFLGSNRFQCTDTDSTGEANRIPNPAGNLAGKTTARPATHDLAYEQGQDEKRSNHRK